MASTGNPSNKLLIKFGNMLKKEILKQYPTVEKFAHENEIPKQTLSQYINGTRDPRLTVLHRITKALEIPIGDLVE